MNIFPGSQRDGAGLLGPDGGPRPHRGQPPRPADPVQELRHRQLQLHQVRPAVQRRPEAQPRHGERQLCQIGGHGREGCDSGRRKKYLKYLHKIFTFTIYMLCMCVTKERKYSTH